MKAKAKDNATVEEVEAIAVPPVKHTRVIRVRDALHRRDAWQTLEEQD